MLYTFVIGIVLFLLRLVALFSNKIDSSMKLILFAGVSGVLFNWVVSLSILHSVGFDMLIPYLIVGIPYDLLHVVGNITLSLIHI